MRILSARSVLAALLITTSAMIFPTVLCAQQTSVSPGSPQSASPSATQPTTSPPQTALPTGTDTSAVATSDASRPKSRPGDRPLASLLGMTLAQADAAFGPPEQVFPVRGQQAWEDDVVFYYPDHSYLFWFRDRVWQVRVDRRFTGTAIGVAMGESRSQVEAMLGQPFYVGNESEIFILPDRGFPVRARLFFTDDQLSDLYVYRGDF